MPTLGLSQVSEDGLWTDTTDHHSEDGGNTFSATIISDDRAIHPELDLLIGNLTTTTNRIEAGNLVNYSKE